jgi:hypothetical protein
MGKRTWKPGNHHWIPKESNWAKQNRNLWKEVYDKDKFKTHMSGEEHKETHREEREFGPIGSLSLYELRRLTEQYDGESSDYEDTEDEDY